MSLGARLPTSSRHGSIQGPGVTGSSPRQPRNRLPWLAPAAAAGLLVLTVVVVVGSVELAEEATKNGRDVRLAAAYTQIATGVAAEESLERKYRLEPGPVPLAAHRAARASVQNGLQKVQRLGTAADRRLAVAVNAEHDDYVMGAGALFAAVDSHQSTSVVNMIDAKEVDPGFGRMQMQVYEASDRHQAQAQASAASMNGISRRIAVLNVGTLLAVLLLVFMAQTAGLRSRRRLHAQSELNRHQAMHDSLTHLPNRALLQERIQQALHVALGSNSQPAVLLIDLDRFKEINDTLGHDYGDLLLTQVAERFARSVRADDVVARLGGDEFAVLLSNATLETAAAAADRLSHCLQEPFLLHDISIDVEASIGIAVSNADSDVQSLLRHADVAMYEAKRHHADYYFYEASHDENTIAGLALLGDLRRAVSGGELLLHYQPKVSSSSGQVHSVEALVRWKHPTRGLVPPDDFIPIAEGTAVIHPLTAEVLRLALTQARVWRDSGRSIPVSINISARSLLDVDFPSQVQAQLDALGLPASCLILELTESAVMADPRRALSVLKALDAQGVNLSIDDFGTGYSSMAYLKALPVTELKIDRSFVMGMSSDKGDAILVQSAVDLGHNLGLRVVAEGVEDAATQDALAAMGCDLVQGYFINRPVPAATFDAWLATRQSPRVPTSRASR